MLKTECYYHDYMETQSSTFKYKMKQLVLGEDIVGENIAGKSRITIVHKPTHRRLRDTHTVKDRRKKNRERETDKQAKKKRRRRRSSKKGETSESRNK